MKKMKKLLSLLLTLAMVAGLLPVAAFATQEDTPVCVCTALCTQEQGNAECPVCAADPALCACKPEPAPEQQAPVCGCTAPCTEDSKNAECPICSAEDADLNLCKGQTDPAPEEQPPVCGCTAPCTEDSKNAECPICGADGADLSLCNGKTEPAPEGQNASGEESTDPEQPTPVCSCMDPCTQGNVNTACPVCGAEGADIAACAAQIPEPQLLTATPPIALYTLSSGSGTQDDPYQIATQADLAGLATDSSGKYYKLTADITLDANWSPIPSFSGTLDGASYTISGLSVSGSGTLGGIVNKLGSSGTIRNLKVSGSVTCTSGSSTRVGGIAGESDGTISDCTFSGTVTGPTTSYNHAVGGIVGINRGTVTNCANNASVTGFGTSSLFIGGIAGSNHGTITYCTNNGTISGTASKSNVYVGDLWGSTKWQNSGGYVGGIAGDTDGKNNSGNVNNANNGTIIYNGETKVDNTPKFTATVTVRKNNATWTDCNYPVELRSGSTTVAMTGTDGVYTTDRAFQSATYEVYANNENTNITVTKDAASVAVDYYTVTYDKGSATGGTPPAEAIVLKNGSYTVNQYSGTVKPPLTLAGYTQIGWTGKEKFQGAGGGATPGFSNLDEAKELYPLWKIKTFDFQQTATYGGKAVNDKEPYNVYQPGADLVLTVKLSHEAEGTFTRQWKKKGPSDTQWSEIPGAKGETYTVSNPDAGTYSYLCECWFKSSKNVTLYSGVSFGNILIQKAKMSVTAPTATATYNQITVESPVSGQKYLCLAATEAAPDTTSSGWQECTNGDLIFQSLDRDKAYRVYTYTPATDTTNHSDSDVVPAQVQTAKEKITQITPPGNVTLTEYYTTVDEVFALLGRTVAVTTEGNSLNELDIYLWTGSYDKTPGATSNFAWHVAPPPGYQFANGVWDIGTITVNNKAATPVMHTPNNQTTTYNGQVYDVGQLFLLGQTTGTPQYTIEGGDGTGSLKGADLTITKTGTFTIKVTTPANGNYAEGEATATLTVQKATVPVPTDPASKEYNGQLQTASMPANAAWTVTQNDGGTNVGDYDVVVTLENPDLYKWATGAETAADRTLTFQITQAQSTCTQPELTAAYNQITVKNPQANQKYLCLAADAPAPVAGSDDWKAPVDGNMVFDSLVRNTAYKVYTYTPADRNHTQSGVVNAEITTAKERITALTAPQPFTLAAYYTGVEAAKAELPTTAPVVTEGKTLTGLQITWKEPATYDAAPGKAHSFAWSVDVPEGYQLAQGLQTSGTILVTNKAAIAVTHTPKKDEITYDGSDYDVRKLFDLGKTDGTASYAITVGNSLGQLKDTTLTITKAGTFTIKVTTEAKGNYAAGEATATLTVHKAVVPVPAAPESKVYDGTLQVAEIIAPHNAPWTVTKNKGGTDAGEYEVIVALGNNDLFRWETGEDTPTRKLTFQITQATRACVAPILTATYHSVTVTNPQAGQLYCCLPANDPEPLPMARNAAWRKPTGAALVFDGLDRDTPYAVYTYFPADKNHEQSDGKPTQISTAKEQITAIAAPTDTVLAQYYSAEADVILALKKTTQVETEGRSLKSRDIHWNVDGAYDPTPGKQNGFRWEIIIPEGYELAQGVQNSGVIAVTNRAATAVTHRAKDAEITYDGNPYDVSALFTLDENAGAATYAVTGAGTLNGAALTIAKAGVFEIKVTTAAIGNYAAGEATATLTVHKATAPVPEAPADKVYNGKLQTADMPASAAWTVAKNDGGTDVGKYQVTVALNTDLYQWETGEDTPERTLTFQITKAIPQHTVPTGLRSCVGRSTQDVSLPNGWAWKEKVALTEAKSYPVTAVFTPADTKNYSTVEQELSITVTEHTAGAWEITRQPTCTETGSRHKTCTACHAELAAEEIPALGHRFGAPAYAWSQDGRTCTAARVCEHDQKHIEYETVTTTSTPGRKPTCTTKGETIYTATFSAAWAQAQTYTLADVAETGHTDSNRNNVCDVCGATISKKSTSPKTGDTANPTVWVFVMLLSLTGVGITVQYGRKRK